MPGDIVCQGGAGDIHLRFEDRGFCSVEKQLGAGGYSALLVRFAPAFLGTRLAGVSTDWGVPVSEH